MTDVEAAIRELEEQRSLLGTRCVALARRVAALETDKVTLESDKAALEERLSRFEAGVLTPAAAPSKKVSKGNGGAEVPAQTETLADRR